MPIPSGTAPVQFAAALQLPPSPTGIHSPVGEPFEVTVTVIAHSPAVSVAASASSVSFHSNANAAMRPMYVSSPVFANVTTVCVPSAMFGFEQHSV